MTLSTNYRLASLMASILLAGGLLAQPASGTIATGSDAVYLSTLLPGPRNAPGLAWTGTDAYILGGTGFGVFSNQILRFVPDGGDGVLSVMPTTLPFPTAGGAAVWTGEAAYLFGGHEAAAPNDVTDKIVRYDPATGMVTTLSAVLPQPLVALTAVWDGSAVYLFGGGTGTFSYSDKIYRFDPAAETITLLPATLPQPTSGGYAVWTGTAIYYVGGAVQLGPLTPSNSIIYTNAILRFDSSAGTITQVGSMPSGWAWGGVVWDGAYVYALGGQSGLNPTNFNMAYTIARYDPSTNAAIAMSDSLPQTGELFIGATFVHGCSAYGVGVGSGLNRIVRYGVCPNEGPQNLPPVAAFGAAPVLLNCDGRTIRFDASESFDAEGQIVTFAWDFGDQGIGYGVAPMHTYSPGEYVVTLTVTDAANQSDSITLTIHIPMECGTSVRTLPPLQRARGGIVPDVDMDGVQDIADNCPQTPNRDQADTDRDGAGDACDPIDCMTCAPPNRAETPATGLADLDGDGIPDGSDNCAARPNLDQADLDGDQQGDVCDADLDGDGVINWSDNCPLTPNSRQPDWDLDGIGDSCQSMEGEPEPPKAYSSRGLQTAGQATIGSSGLLSLLMVLLCGLLVAQGLRASKRNRPPGLGG